MEKYIQVSGNFSPRAFFQEKFGEYPNIFNIENLDTEKVKSRLGNLILIKEVENLSRESYFGPESEAIEIIYNHGDISTRNWSNTCRKISIYQEDEGIWIVFSVYYSKNSIEVLHVDKKRNDASKIKEELFHFLKKKEKKSYIQILCNNGRDLYLHAQEIEDNFSCDINLNYGEKFEGEYEKLLKSLKNNNKGLFLLSSKPGFGKTTLIKHLVKNLPDYKTMLLPPGMAKEFSNPSFIPFLLKEKIDLIVCEDAEIALLSRDEIRNEAVSSILNMTDGIMGDVLKTKILCTFNVPTSRVDSALLRPGRLKYYWEFEALKIAECDRLLEHLGHPKQGKEMSLAEIYNFGETSGFKEKEKRSMNIFGS